MTNRPERITCREDAVHLWKHLLARGISFHWEDDPADWVDTTTGVASLSSADADDVRRLLDEVDELSDERCFRDAQSLLRVALLLGPQVVAWIPDESAGRFDRCDSEADVLATLTGLTRRRLH